MDTNIKVTKVSLTSVMVTTEPLTQELAEKISRFNEYLTPTEVVEALKAGHRVYTSFAYFVVQSSVKPEHLEELKLDLHASTASKLFNAPASKLTTEMRRVGGIVNFASLYGRELKPEQLLSLTQQPDDEVTERSSES